MREMTTATEANRETYNIKITGMWEGEPVEGEYTMGFSEGELGVVLRYTAPEGDFERRFRYKGEAFEWAMSEARSRRDIGAA